MQPKQIHSQLEQVNKGKRRRLKLFWFFMAVFLLWSGSVWLDQQRTIKLQKEDLAIIQGKVQAAKELQMNLTEEARRLQDPEYIAEVARRDYFLSRPGEVIFRVSEK